MKISITILIISLFSISALAQNWKPINKDEKFNYLGADSYYATIWVDSAKLDGIDSVYFFNKIIRKVKNGSGLHVYGYYLANQSQFLFSKMVLCSNHDVVFEESKNKRYRIKPLAKMNDQWVFDSINNVTAQISRVYAENVLGYLDSVKVITLSSSDSIVLSKNSGLLKFPLFNSLKQHVKLVGIEGRDAGNILPKYLDFFDFNVGDVFYYESSSSGRWTIFEKWEKLTILSKEIKNNAYLYKADYRSKNKHYQYTNLVRTVYKNVPDTVLTFSPKESFLNDYPNEILNDPRVGYTYKPIVVKLDETFKTVTKSFIENAFCKSSTDTILECTVSPNACIRIRYTENYGKNIGLVLRYYYLKDWAPWGDVNYTQLVGCIRNGQSYGRILDDTIFPTTNVEEETVTGKEVKIYPNPAHDWLTIDTFSDNQNSSIYICDLNGKELLSQKLVNASHQIYIGNLNPGIYLAKYLSLDRVKVERFIKK